MEQTEQAQLGKLHRLFDGNFLEYTSYVIKERAIPDIDDGLKPVQRRILQTLANMDDGRFQKVANVVGETMKLHPHGDASIFSALVNLANKGYLIDRQGNFGNIYTGDQASAPRYIECGVPAVPEVAPRPTRQCRARAPCRTWNPDRRRQRRNPSSWRHSR